MNDKEVTSADSQTPVLFLIFNRPDTTKQVFEAIRQVRPARLFVAADGPRGNKLGEKEKCMQTRRIVDEGIDWDCQVYRLYRDSNLGCKKAVSSAIGWFFEHVEEGIILEDDCLPDSTFFPFCGELLERYRYDERVMMITGTNYFSDKIVIEESYFFSQHFTVWGWATWRRAWRLYDVEMKGWEKIRAEKQLAYLTSKPFIKKHFEITFDLIAKSKMDTWDIQWVFACLFNHGLCVTPNVNLISNIGVDGTHAAGKTTDSHFLKAYKVDVKNLIHPKLMFTNRLYDEVLHVLKSKPAVRKTLIREKLRMMPMYNILRNTYKKMRKI